MNRLTEEEIRQGYRLLFDGSTLEGWAATQYPDGWAVEQECIVCDAKGRGYLYTIDVFSDFVLHIDFKTERKVNSGLFFRWSDLKDPVNTGLEMQIHDTYDKKETPGNRDAGAVYGLLAPSTNAVRPAGEWNHVELRCVGSRIQISLNDTTIIDMDIDCWNVAGQNPDGTANKFTFAWKELPKTGHFGLQNHGGHAWFRNIKLVTVVREYF